MTFEQDYKSFIDFALIYIKKKKLQIQPEDLVNDAFIKFTDSKQNYNPSYIRKLILEFLYKEFGHEIAIVSEFHVNQKITSLHCKTCGETKPISGFYFTTINSVQFPHLSCKTCDIEKYKQYYQANKQYCLDLQKRWKENNKYHVKLVKKLYHKNNYVPAVKKQKPPKPPKPIKVKIVKIKIIKPKRKKLTTNQKRIKWNEYVKKRRAELNKDKPKRIARPIHELWKEANRRYYAKKKALKKDTLLENRV